MPPSGVIIHMRNVPNRGDGWRALDWPLPCEMWDDYEGDHTVPMDFEWDGNSSGWMSPIFPKWNHPIASCRHDWRCLHAKNAEQRLWADKRFKEDVGTTSWKITAELGYLGVRMGALLGIGVRY